MESVTSIFLSFEVEDLTWIFISGGFLFFMCSLAEQLESIKESLNERGLSALSLFLESKKVNSSFKLLT